MKAIDESLKLLTILSDGNLKTGGDVLREYRSIFKRDIPKGTAYTLLTRLENQGMIRKLTGCEDARARRYRITSKGHRVVSSASSDCSEFLAAYMLNRSAT